MEPKENRAEISSLRIDKSRKFDDRPKSNVWRYLLAAVGIVVLILVYFQFREKVVPSTKVQSTSVILLGGSDATADLVATGYVVAQRMAEVASKGTGRLEYLGFEEGDTVSAGEVIARLDNNDMKANLNVAAAALRQAEVDTLNAGRDFRRRKALLQSGAITNAELELSETNYNNALARVQGSAAAVTVAEVNLENTFIRAPFNGTVLMKNADVGEIVAPFASSASSKGSVVTLADMNSLEVEADVNESNIVKVQIGQRCEIVLDAYPSVTYAGHVKKIVPTADRSRATVLTKIAFDEIDKKVLPEMSARVNFFTKQEDTTSAEVNAIAVDKEAITSRNGQSIVFRIDGDRATAVPVTTGRELGRLVEIISGLSQGDQVVLSPPGKMTTGQKIELSS